MEIWCTPLIHISLISSAPLSLSPSMSSPFIIQCNHSLSVCFFPIINKNINFTLMSHSCKTSNDVFLICLNGTSALVILWVHTLPHELLSNSLLWSLHLCGSVSLLLTSTACSLSLSLSWRCSTVTSKSARSWQSAISSISYSSTQIQAARFCCVDSVFVVFLRIWAHRSI